MFNMIKMLRVRYKIGQLKNSLKIKIIYKKRDIWFLMINENFIKM